MPRWLVLGCGIYLLMRPGNGMADVPAAVLRAEQQRIAAMAKAVPASIAIFTSDGNGGGSGVVISPDGYALSNFHVTSPVGDYMKCGMPDGRLYDAVIVGIDPTGDVALLKLLGRDDFPAAEFGDSDQVRAGDWCFAVGNPFLLATDLQPTVSFGIVSGVHRYQYPAGSILEYADCLQTDAAINPGNSGGPLFNAAGQLIGIVGRGSFEKRGRVNVGVGYAISINQVKNFLGDLRSGRVVDHATLGATVSRDEQGRVVVTNILESSDAFRRGLRYGDELVAFGGRSIRTVNAFKNVLGIFPEGWRVPLSYRRDDEKHDIYVRLAGVHTPAELLKLLEREQPPEEPGGRDRPRPKSKQRPEPREAAPRPAAAPIPAEAAQQIRARSGFKNYYFNEIERNRVWNRFTALSQGNAAGGAWSLAGKLASGGDVSATLTDQQSELQWPGVQTRIDEQQGLAGAAEQADAGVALALHLWRRLLLLGPGKYGEVHYRGRAPLPGREGLFDVIRATRDVTESWWYFDPTEGQLVALELFPDSDVDPCELLFYDYRPTGGAVLPHRIVARRGAEPMVEINLSEFTVSP